MKALPAQMNSLEARVDRLAADIGEINLVDGADYDQEVDEETNE